VPKKALKLRLNDVEDSLTERKTSYSFNEAIRTIVAFANSVPENRSGVLFIGIDDSGNVVGVEGADKLQQKIITDCANKVYPPIYPTVVVLNVGEKLVIAVEITNCPRKPYFSGPAYIRRGSESIKANEEAYNDLIMNNYDKCGWIINYKKSNVTVKSYGKKLGSSMRERDAFTTTGEFRIEDVTPYFVKFKNISTDQYITEELCFLNISWDDEKNRPKLVARFPF
jgi:hypothetical protein